MTKRSAGLLLYRIGDGGDVDVLIGHPGGPFWARKDDGAWSVPKGEFDPAAEDPAVAAAREFEEEIGSPPPTGPWQHLGTVAQSRAKRVTAFAGRGDVDPATLRSNVAEIEWPPRSGRPTGSAAGPAPPGPDRPCRPGPSPPGWP